MHVHSTVIQLSKDHNVASHIKNLIYGLRLPVSNCLLNFKFTLVHYLFYIIKGSMLIDGEFSNHSSLNHNSYKQIKSYVYNIDENLF